MEVWVAHGMTESGDDWCLVFGYEPTHDQVEAQVKVTPWLKDEFEEGCVPGWVVVCERVIY